MPQPRNEISILLSEGSSLSARQAITALGPLGYQIDILDSNPMCMGAMSRFVRQRINCPRLGREPIAYLKFVIEHLKTHAYDVLLPTHEQAFLFSKAQQPLGELTGLALTPFEQYHLLQSKVTFAWTMAEVDLPQPATSFLPDADALSMVDDFPCYVKSEYSTAGQGVWHIQNRDDLDAARAVLLERESTVGQSELVVQDVAGGLLCQAQAVFEHGRLIGVHCTQQQAVGKGNSQAARLSVDHPTVRDHLQKLGDHLGWHGALALDYLYDRHAGPAYIEANPRLVEPMNAVYAGCNLPQMLVELSLGKTFADLATQIGRFGVRSHSMVAILVGAADRSASRRDLARILGQRLVRRGIYRKSREALTPMRIDWKSSAVLAYTVGFLLKNPENVRHLSDQTVTDYALTPNAVAEIEAIP